MFDIAPSEMLIVALVAIVLIGPKDLPRVMRVLGQWMGRGKAMARHFRTAVDDMVRDAELAEMEQKWKAENERIMREHSGLIEGSATPAATAVQPPAEAPVMTPLAPPAEPAAPVTPATRES